jgi:hypothetical protein
MKRIAIYLRVTGLGRRTRSRIITTPEGRTAAEVATLLRSVAGGNFGRAPDR